MKCKTKLGGSFYYFTTFTYQKMVVSLNILLRCDALFTVLACPRKIPHPGDKASLDGCGW